MIMSSGVRKAALTAHVTSSVGWLGAVAVFLAIAVAGVTSDQPETVRAAYIAMDLAASFVIVPLALASVTTGLIQALATHWGLARHYWVIVKLVITVVAAVVLLLQLDSIGYLADRATNDTVSGTDLGAAKSSLVVHAGGGLLVLLVPMVLSIYKPRGMTRYGQRRVRRPPAAAAS